MRILGIDYGEARTGLAISDENEVVSTVLQTVHERNHEKLADTITAICKEKEIQKIVLGLPKNMDGSEGFRAEYTRKFQKMLEERLPNLLYDFYDERLTTVAASYFMQEAGTRGNKKKASIDALSAQIILQDYLDHNNR